LIAKSRTDIYNSKYPLCILKSTDFDGSQLDSIEEIESRISSMKVVELKAELKSHGQARTGVKKILQERLLDFYNAQLENSEEESSGDNDMSSEDIDNVDSEPSEEDIGDTEEYERLERELTFEMEEEEEEDYDIDDDNFIVDNQDDEPLPIGLLSSKQKWKKKTYLLMSDARKLVYSKDTLVRQQAPKKAQQVVRRIQRWIALSSSTPSLSAKFEDDEIVETDDEMPVIEILDLESVEEFQEFQKSTLLRAYNIWIHAIAKSGDDNTGYQAEHILNEMQENIPYGGPSPDEITIASVMDAHAHSATISSSKSGAQAAEAFLFELLEKSEAADDGDDVPWSQDGSNKLRDSLIVTCDTMLNAWAREGTMESAERAQLILLRLEEYQRQREKQRKKGQSKKSSRNSSSEGETTTASVGNKRPISYATVMNAFANVGTAEAALQAEATLESLVQRAKADIKENKGQDDRSKLVLVEPDTIVFNSVIQCWATTNDKRAGKRSQRLVDQMKDLAGMSESDESKDEDEEICFDTHPDIITYNTVLSAWSRCGKKDAAPRAEKIVKDLILEQQKSNSDSVAANTITFNTVLNAWSRSPMPGAADRADKLLEYMIQSDNSEIKPDVYSFTTVLNTWAKSKEPNKASHARKLLSQQIEMYQEALKNGNKSRADALKPTQIPYNAVMNACAFSAQNTTKEEKKEAIQIAVDTYKGMVSFDSPARRNGNKNVVSRDPVTYGLVLKAIANLMPRGNVRNRMALQIFDECRENGLVGTLAWSEIRRAVPIKLVQEACQMRRPCGSLDAKDLPKAWRSNIREGQYKKYKRREQNSRREKTKDKSKQPKPPPKPATFIVERSFATGKDL